MVKPQLIGSIVGTVEGVIPGAGGTIASFLSYNEAHRWSKTKEEFGKGSPEGVAAPETANNTVAATALVPLLSFGIPGSNSAAILLGGLLIHGLVPGPRLFEENADAVVGLYTGLFVANLSLLLIGSAILPVCLWLVNRSKAVLMAFIYALIFSGVYTINFSLFDVGLVLAAGTAGLVMRILGLPLLPAVLGVVLGFLVESNYRRSLVLSGGEHSIFLEDPIAIVLLSVAGLFIMGSVGTRIWSSIRTNGGSRGAGIRMNKEPRQPVAVTLAEWIAGFSSEELPEAVTKATAHTLIDTIGLAFAARNTDYVEALGQSWTETGACTVIGSKDSLSPEAAAMINGAAAHGEDFDNTFEGCPVHPGAVIVPAVFAIAEAKGLNGADVLRGITVGQEVMCRIGLVVEKGTHAAGFHPTGVIGSMGATAAIAAATGAAPTATTNALGIAGSMASGIIEYLSDGSSTKRMHAGWAAQSGLRALAMGRAGFKGPATVFEGEHGFFHAFAPSVSPDLRLLTEELGSRWEAARLAFKPFACGTMVQPFVDCAIRLGKRGIGIEDISELTCSVGEGTVHRLWEPLELKRNPPTGYAAKFSTPYCIAVSFLRGKAGLAEFDETLVQDPEIRALSNKVGYRIDPDDEYPQNYTGHVRAILTDGSVVEERQPYLRGGVREPLDREELIDKCAANLGYGGGDPGLASAIAEWADRLRENTTVIPRLPV